MRRPLLTIYLFTFVVILLLTIGLNQSVSVMSEEGYLNEGICIVIDPGHGGIDGGAVSCTGAYESEINLEISLRLRDLFHLLGYQTKMIRTEDKSVYTEGESIAQKKMSDLKARVDMISKTPGAILLSIHQNSFSQKQYAGAQVFYGKSDRSKELAEQIQTAFTESINPGSNRKPQKGESIYILKHTVQPGVLIECGFLSNPKEEQLLRTPDYQQKICCVIAIATIRFLSAT